MYAKDEDNVTTKLKSLMLQSIGKRDIGQCEVCRLLMSEPLYSSSFEYTESRFQRTIKRKLQ